MKMYQTGLTLGRRLRVGSNTATDRLRKPNASNIAKGLGDVQPGVGLRCLRERRKHRHGCYYSAFIVDICRIRTPLAVSFF